MGVVTVGELKPSISGKRSFRPSSSIRHATEWPISDVSSDLTVEVGTSSFSLHKFPLVSHSGRIRKLLLEAKDPKVSRINLSSVPGGAEAFELAAKFCYDINVEMTPSNVPGLLCAARFLEMREDLAEKNLESRAEAYLKGTVLQSIPSSIAALRRCESLLPAAEECGLVARLVAAVASIAGREQLASGLLKLDRGGGGGFLPELPEETPPEWWGKSLTVLGLELFTRVVSAVKAKGVNQEVIGKILVSYAHGSLLGSGHPEAQRKVVEAVVELLPGQSRKGSVPMAFLSGLLKTAAAVSASARCRAELERRIGLRLDQAILEDILLPSTAVAGGGGGGGGGGGTYDTDAVVRIFSTFLNLDDDDDDDDDGHVGNGRVGDGDEMGYGFESPESPKQSSILKVSKLLDNFLAEVALDSNLPPSKFIALAELLPDHARLVTDGLYRAVDIFLKVHPNIKESERYRLCKTMECQKLSQEACSHAAQNERLPVQTAVQVLYFEQMRLRNAMSSGSQGQFFFGHFPQRSGSGAGSGAISPRDNYASVRRENRELKLEVARMRMRLTDLEKDHVSMKQELVRTHPANKLFRSFANKLTKLNNLFRFSSVKPNPKPGSETRRFPFHKRRRHSVS